MKKWLLALVMAFAPAAVAGDGEIIGKALQSLDAGMGWVKPDPPSPDPPPIIIYHVIKVGNVFVVVDIEII